MRTLLIFGLLLAAISSANAAVDSTRYVGSLRDLTPDEVAHYHKLSGTEAQAYLNTRGYYHRCLRVKGVETPSIELQNLKIRPSPFKFDLMTSDEQDTYNGVISDWINQSLTIAA